MNTTVTTQDLFAQLPGFDIPLSVKDHDLARQFAAEQTSPAKGKRVYLNTLAVAALHTYLTWLDIETDLDSSYSYHPLQLAVFDRADLYIPDLGRLDCVVALPGETLAASPLASEDTIAQVLVQFSESLSSVRLVGYRLVIGEPEDEVLTDFDEGWFDVEQLPDTLLRWQIALDNLQSSDDERIKLIQNVVNDKPIDWFNNWQAVLAISSSCMEKPRLLGSKIRGYYAANAVARMDRPVTANLSRGEAVSKDETLSQVEEAMKGALNFLSDLWRSLE